MQSIGKYLLLYVPPIVLTIALIEALVLSRRQAYDWRAFGVSAFDLVTRLLVNVFLPLSIATPAIEWAVAHRITTISLDGWGAGLLLFFGQEFCYYWFHRAAHRVRWFWANHSVHHSPNELNLSASVRLGILGKFSGTALFFVPLIWLGFEARVVFTVITLNLLYQFWIHATWIPKLGWLEGVLNTPSAHRVHHAANLEYLDANYGGVLMIFDRLFGTYIPEREDLPCRYGLVHPQTSYNPLRVEFREWGSMLRDLWHAGSVRAFFGYIFMPPGWTPEGEGNTTEDLRARQAKEKALPEATTA